MKIGGPTGCHGIMERQVTRWLIGNYEDLEVPSQGSDRRPVKPIDNQTPSHWNLAAEPGCDVAGSSEMMGAAGVHQEQSPVPPVASKMIRGAVAVEDTDLGPSQISVQRLGRYRFNHGSRVCLDQVVETGEVPKLRLRGRQPNDILDLALPELSDFTSADPGKIVPGQIEATVMPSSLAPSEHFSSRETWSATVADTPPLVPTNNAGCGDRKGYFRQRRSSNLRRFEDMVERRRIAEIVSNPSNNARCQLPHGYDLTPSCPARTFSPMRRILKRRGSANRAWSDFS